MRPIIKLSAIGALGLAMVLAATQFTQSQPAGTYMSRHVAANQGHRVIIQVTQNDAAVMNMALNNAENLVKFYKGKGEDVQIEMVAYGAGLHMVRNDTSPVKERLTAITRGTKNVTVSGCENTMNNQSRLENKAISLVPEARLVPAGIARVVELEERGWSYVRP
jgi:intracellular sulfur oxidation DsrE/DsrF family protein